MNLNVYTHSHLSSLFNKTDAHIHSTQFIMMTDTWYKYLKVNIVVCGVFLIFILHITITIIVLFFLCSFLFSLYCYPYYFASFLADYEFSHHMCVGAPVLLPLILDVMNREKKEKGKIMIINWCSIKSVDIFLKVFELISLSVCHFFHSSIHFIVFFFFFCIQLFLLFVLNIFRRSGRK